MMPILDFLIYPFLTLGVIIGNKVGPRMCVLISFSIQCFSFVILSFTTSYNYVLLAMALFGLGHAIGYLTSMKNIWKYFPNKPGFIFGLVVSGSGLSSSIFTPIADFIIINPDKKSTESNGIYPKEVADRLKIFLYLATCLFITFGTIGTLGTFKYEEDEIDNIDRLTAGSEDQNNNENNEKKEEEKPKENKNDELGRFPIKEALFSKKNAQILVFCFCGFCK